MKKYAVLLSAILAIVFMGCDVDENFGLDSSWRLVENGDTTIIQKNDTIHDSIIVVDSLVLTTKSYQVLRDDVVVYEIEVNSDKSTVGVFDFERAYGVANGSRQSILVKSEDKLNGVSYAAGNFNSNSEAWKSGSYWSGENVKGMVSFTMANDSVSADFVDTYYSSSATLAKDTMTVIFPSLNWTSSYALDSTSVYNKSNGDSLFKVKDFITTTTFVAEVNPDFVKEGEVSTKSFEVRDTLSLMYFVEPDPEDQIIDTVAYGSVEKMNGVINGIGRWYERHTLLDSVLVKEQKQAFNAELKAENGEAVYASNANYQTIGNGWTGNGNVDYINDATNGAGPFANTYKVSADKGMTMSFNGIDIIFTTEFVLTEAGQTIGSSELVNINNVHYDVYPYANKVNGKYTVKCGNESQSVEMSATANREIRVKAADQITEAVENQSFYAQFKTEGSVLSTIKYGNAWDYTTYNFGVEANRESFEHNMTVSAEITGAEDFKVQDKNDLSKEYKITSITETANESEQVEENGVRIERTTRFFNATVNNGKTLQVKVITEKDLTKDINLGYMSLVDVKDGGLTSTVNGNEVTLQPAVKILLQENYATTASKAPLRGATAAAASNVKSYTISTEMVGTYTPSVDTVRVPKYNGNPTVETYVVTDGDSVLVKTETYAPYFAITANNGEDVKASDYAFVTTFDGTSGETIKSIQDGNFYITRVSGNIKSHLSNGTVSANNEGQYAYDKVVTYKNGNDNFIFNAVVNFTENTDLIVANGEKTVEDVVYNAYAYKTTFNMSYTCAGFADNKSASVSRNILVAKEVEDLVPGTILSLAVTAVPARWTDSGFVGSSGHQQAIKGLTIITTDGKGCSIPFAGADDTNALLPSNEAIAGATYVDGGYDATYNSGYYLPGEGWKPAVVTENGIQILYKDHGEAVRSLTQKSMSTWSWRNGNYSAYVGGYTFSVKDGVATVKYNDVLVAQFK